MLQKRVKVLRWSAPVWSLILLAAIFTIAAAAILFLISSPFGGNVLALDYNINDVYSNDDGVSDALDNTDDGMDPSEVWAGQGPAVGVTRFTYDIASCLAVPDAGQFVNVTWTNAYADTFCEIVMVIQNDSDEVLDLVDVRLVGTAPVEITMPEGLFGCGEISIPIGESRGIHASLALAPSASGSWDSGSNAIEVEFAVAGTYDCTP